MKKNKPKKRQTSLNFRETAMRKLTTEIGVYVLCDLDEVPIYVGQSRAGIRGRVRRHLTSARSDVIANRQIDVWEIAYVKAWPVKKLAEIPHLEALLFKTFDRRKALMNGSIPALRKPAGKVPPAAQTVQVMSDEDIKVRRDPMLRLPRQIEHIGRLVDHILSVKDSQQLRRSLAAHFERLEAYRDAFLRQTGPVTRAPGKSDEE
ncbi:MAG: GIY-YIG nuclease family protein [Pseudomonadota bacterium]